LRTEGVFVKTHNWRLARRIVNGYDVIPARAFANTALSKEVLRCARQAMLFPGRDAKFGQNRHFFAPGARAQFDEGELFAGVAGLVDFLLRTAGSEVSGYEN
jgi:hypothetical protein